MSGWNLLVIGPFLSMEVLCGYSKMIENVGIIGDWVGRLGMWRILDGKDDEWPDLKFRAPRWYSRLCRLRPRSVGSEWTSFDYVLAHTGFMGSRKHNSFVCWWDESYPTIPHGCIEGIVHGPSTDRPVCGIAWKPCTRVRWALIVCVTMSWTIATHGALLAHVWHVVRFITLQDWLLIQISTTPSEMDDACSPNLNIELSTS
jgi:hypothetical protein